MILKRLSLESRAEIEKLTTEVEKFHWSWKIDFSNFIHHCQTSVGLTSARTFQIQSFQFNFELFNSARSFPTQNFTTSRFSTNTFQCMQQFPATKTFFPPLTFTMDINNFYYNSSIKDFAFSRSAMKRWWFFDFMCRHNFSDRTVLSLI